MSRERGSALARLWRGMGRIRYRLLAVNLFVVLVPVVGLEFARVYERQLLEGLERDMQNQAVLVRSAFEAALDADEPFDEDRWWLWLTQAARQTRTRVRLVSAGEGVVSDSHRYGPPEGPEPRAPLLAARDSLHIPRRYEAEAFQVPLLERAEIKKAFAGARATSTRVAHDPPAVYLFLAEPVRSQGRVWGAVYVTRSTAPVLLELHRIRRALFVVLAVALGFGFGITLLLAWSISRPLERLAGSARRIAGGALDVEVPSGGGGEIAELASAFAEMTHKLERRHRYISEFAADVAHGFKSPLTSIRGAAELLHEGAADDPAARQRFLSNILLDAARLDRLVTRLLELSRIDAADTLPGVIDLDALVRRVVRRFDRPEAPVRLVSQCSVPALFGREGDLETALGNLIDNAQHFSPVGVTVELRVSGRAGDAQVLFQVVDRGPGIARELHDRVFDRFFTTDPEGRGTGLGLAIVHSVAEVHGGSVRLESEPGQGACFELRLPVGTAERLLRPRAHRAAPTDSGRSSSGV